VFTYDNGDVQPSSSSPENFLVEGENEYNE